MYLLEGLKLLKIISKLLGFKKIWMKLLFLLYYWFHTQNSKSNQLAFNNIWSIFSAIRNPFYGCLLNRKFIKNFHFWCRYITEFWDNPNFSNNLRCVDVFTQFSVASHDGDVYAWRILGAWTPLPKSVFVPPFVKMRNPKRVDKHWFTGLLPLI